MLEVRWDGGMHAMPVAIAALLVAVLAGCTGQPERAGSPAPVPTPTVTAEPTADPLTVGPVQPVGGPVTIVGGLAAPWSMVPLDDGSTLISERDSGLIKELLPDGSLREVAQVAGVVASGEGGLLGLEYVEDGPWLYAYFTAASDNRIVRFELSGRSGSYSLSDSRDILTGLAKAGNHNGGRIKLGPDGMLYATVGDAGAPNVAQDPAALNGKILRMELDGSAPADNPFPGSLVYSYGHRNPQGLAWDRDGQLWAAEFGQDTWDEVNMIVAGANYGWPVVEGASDDPAFVSPVYQWATDDASPSGLVWTRDTFFMAALRGERIWAIYPSPGSTQAVEWFTGVYGRIRDVVPGPNGSLWVLTNNTDGRGSAREGDDRILQVELAPLAEG
ncbi:MAG: PQQ-dependent sugar dehydrogenase [Rhodoglobus sp.]|nr:PQQ-dependent sugar dehydrogenase [Rhodoglobus sp.]